MDVVCSVPGLGAAAPSGSEGAMPLAGGAATASDTLRPQFLQNRAPALSSVPHSAQRFCPSPTAIAISSSAANTGTWLSGTQVDVS